MNPANWNDENGNPGVPGANDFAIVGGFDAIVSQPVNIFAVTLDGGSITGANGAALTVSKLFVIYGGTIRNLNMTIDSDALLSLVGEKTFPMSGTLVNHGRVRLVGGTIVPVPNSGRPGAAGPDGFINAVGIVLPERG